ncbi:Bop2p [Lachancea thermotolerans CBS 6340]|uniref:KLTH0C01408p n=1 Tax=Lachancea thermotolerans (strain ATCC 56472 / CBS 6340 / NRRL Y-8284) TaxID=559295 RepID=C5DDJ1_LACTC|nr:KLTH0C01408p [Lachancea thermotolerans CBS 6340]CAR21852.1 KLTH0C01408p [Lachancea thermotolerans CBS 6340]
MKMSNYENMNMLVKSEGPVRNGLLSLPIEVVEMIVQQLTASPKTTVVDYYHLLQALGETNGPVAALLRSKIAVRDLTRGRCDLAKVLGGSKGSIKGDDTIPSQTSFYVVAIDEDALELAPGATALPAPYGDIQLSLVFHSDRQVPLTEIHEKFRRRFPQDCYRVQHLIVTSSRCQTLEFRANDGNLLDTRLYSERDPMFAQVTYLNASRIVIAATALTEFISGVARGTKTSMPELCYGCNSHLANTLKIHSMLEPPLPMVTRVPVNFPLVESVAFSGSDGSPGSLNVIDLYAFCRIREQDAKLTLNSLLSVYSLRHWNLPSVKRFTGHRLKLSDGSSDVHQRSRSARETITRIRTIAQQESPDGLLHVNAQLVPDGVVHTTIENWIPMEAKFGGRAGRDCSPLICFRNSSLKSLRLGLAMKPEGTLVVEGLYLPSLEKLDVTSYSDDTPRNEVRLPSYSITFSAWNDLDKCRGLGFSSAEFNGHSIVQNLNLKQVFPRLDVANTFRQKFSSSSVLAV